MLETARHLNSAAIHLLRGLRPVDRSAGLTPARLSALSALVFGGGVPLGRLASAEGVAGPTMSRIVDGLVQLGLARRDPHPDSPRMRLVTATPEGHDLMHRAAARRWAAITAAMGRLEPGDQQAVTAAGPALRRLATLVREAAPGTEDAQ